MSHAIEIPKDPADLTPEFLTQVVQTRHPGVVVKSFKQTEHKTYGDTMVSTSDRLRLTLDYAGDVSADLPRRVSVKLKRAIDDVLGELYDTEVNFYVRLAHEPPITSPYALGGICDKETALFYLLLEDLSDKDARFPNATTPVSIDEVRAILDQFAKLHAFYWNSPRLTGDLSWYQNHVDSSLAVRMRQTLPMTINSDMPVNKFKRERVEMLATSVDELHELYCKLENYQATGPQTILHGDGHIGNAYLLPDGSAGLLDFQLTARGLWVHDVNYLILTALDVDVRRKEERGLLTYYLDQLRSYGVETPPDAETAWLEYRRGMLWSFYVGWLTTPIANYGEAINRSNLLRISTALADHDTMSLMRSL